MKLIYILVLFMCGYTVGNLVSRVRLLDHINYIIDVATETVKRIEAREWCNLKVPDAEPIPVDEIVLGAHAVGNVRYINGFVVSIQAVDVLQRTVQQNVRLNGEKAAEATVTGTLRMHDVAIGYDVLADMEDGVHHYTAKYVYPTISMAFTISKILSSETISLTVISGLEAGRNLPAFMPTDRLSDTLTTLFNATLLGAGIDTWATEVFHPIAKDVVTSQIQFPEVCYNCS